MDWIEIKNSEDVNELLNFFGHFHDSCLKELHMWSDHYVDEGLSMVLSGELDHKTRILFQRQDKNLSAIELLFEQVTEMHIIPSRQDYDSLINEATFSFQDGLFYWANDFGWKPEDKGQREVSWLSSQKIKWRDASDWMGKDLRYGVKSK